MHCTTLLSPLQHNNQSSCLCGSNNELSLTFFIRLLNKTILKMLLYFDQNDCCHLVVFCIVFFCAFFKILFKGLTDTGSEDDQPVPEAIIYLKPEIVVFIMWCIRVSVLCGMIAGLRVWCTYESLDDWSDWLVIYLYVVWPVLPQSSDVMFLKTEVGFAFTSREILISVFTCLILTCPFN